VRGDGHAALIAARPAGLAAGVCHTDALAMPKMKTHSGAKKRFKVTAGGKVKARHPFSSHILEKKSPKKKTAMSRPLILNDHDAPRVKKLLGAKSK
jgi:large subunit ribosomal protein L35